MVKLSSWKNRTVSATIEIDGEQVNFKVRPNAMTPAMEVALHTAKGEDAIRLGSEFFVSLVESWDVTDDEGVMIPLEAQTITDHIPSPILMKMLNKLREAISEAGN